MSPRRQPLGGELFSGLCGRKIHALQNLQRSLILSEFAIQSSSLAQPQHRAGVVGWPLGCSTEAVHSPRGSFFLLPST